MNFKNFVEQSELDYKEYQYEGVKWCIDRENSDEYCNGGIIADEMGLGKTIMMIGTMLENFKMPSLIVLPVFLLEQWCSQILKTTGHKVIVYHGRNKGRITKEILSKSPIVITTYGSVLSDSKKNNVLTGVKWSRIICDEAHHMRNRNSKITNAVKNIERITTWLISGTPIQNHINDLYSLLEILKIDKMIFTKIDNLKDIMKKIVLKRTKKEVGLNLPELNINRINIKWKNVSEKKLSENIHDKLSFSLLKQRPIEQTLRLSMMMYARMVCVYPHLINKHINKLQNSGYICDDSVNGVNYNSKMDKVINIIIERQYNGNKKILFVNFKGETDYLFNNLNKKGIKTEYIDGRVDKIKRNNVLKQDNIDVLIIQIKTGNEGLNLQEYNEVYFITPHWNPQVEEQAIARCHRLGQKKKVNVFRFVMNGFDEDMKTQNIEMYSEIIQQNKREIEEKEINNKQ
jgi:SNF2 family DNA or RNA helicase